jgi:hypothetical protein
LRYQPNLDHISLAFANEARREFELLISGPHGSFARAYATFLFLSAAQATERICGGFRKFANPGRIPGLSKIGGVEAHE